MRIVITGTPGTGKTAVAEELAERMNLPVIRIADIVKSRKLDKGKEHEVDIKKLAPELGFLRDKGSYVVEGHLACEMLLPADYIFVLRTHPRVLRERLKKRGYRGQKLEDNLMSEMLDYCVQRVESEYGTKPLELDTTNRPVDESVREIMQAIKQKKKKLDTVNYSKELENHLKLSGSE